MKFRFKQFRVYRESKSFCQFARDIAKRHVEREDKALFDQIQRALNSIVLNIAEGSADNSDREFSRFLGMSIRSLYETVAAFDLAAFYGLISEDVNTQTEDSAHSLVKRLSSFRNSLKYGRVAH